MGKKKITADAGTCHDLATADAKLVKAFMAAVTRAFEGADPDLLDALSHEGGDPKSRRGSYEFMQLLMKRGDKVQSWSARPYTEPKWTIMRTSQFHPPPSIWIDVTLNDGKRDYGIFFSLAPDADGALRSCYYVARTRERKATAKVGTATAGREAMLREATAKAVRRAAQALRKRDSQGGLFGFALCTDDDVRTLYHVACTVTWVRKKEPSYPDIGFIYVEWPNAAPDGPFKTISRQLAALDDDSYSSDESESARDRRFSALVQALQDCRNEGIFDQKTLLCVGSTDPSDHLESLAMRAVDTLNSKSLADRFARALGYERHRSKRAKR